jgi:hypothetical protein
MEKSTLNNLEKYPKKWENIPLIPPKKWGNTPKFWEDTFYKLL